MSNFSGGQSISALPVDVGRKTAVRLARELVNYISDGEIPAGTKLPAEAEMAASFGVGRSTLREALRLLEMRGVLTIRVGRGGGPFVRQPKTTDLADALAIILQFQKATLADIVEARLLLEPAAARQAASRVTPRLLEQLQETVDSMLARPDDAKNFSDENGRFHSLIANTWGNPVLSVYIDCLKYVHDGRQFGIRYEPRHVEVVAHAHLDLIAALRRMDPDEAEASMRRHLEDTQAYWSKKYADIYRRKLRWLDIE